MAKKKNEELAGDSDGDYEEEPNFEDPEGYVDNITDEGIYFLSSRKEKKIRKKCPRFKASTLFNQQISESSVHLIKFIVF